jgi:hypothetical protein
MVKVKDAVTVLDVVSDVAWVTESDQSFENVSVTDIIGPSIIIKPAMILTEKPVDVVEVTDCSFIIETEALTDIAGEMLQDSPPVQLSVLPRICCFPGLV